MDKEKKRRALDEEKRKAAEAKLAKKKQEDEEAARKKEEEDRLVAEARAEEEARLAARKEEAEREAAAARLAAEEEAARLKDELAKQNAEEIRKGIIADIKNLSKTNIGSLQKKIAEIRLKEIPEVDDLLQSASDAISNIIKRLFSALESASKDKLNPEQYQMVQQAMNDLNAAGVGGYTFSDEQKQLLENGSTLLLRLAHSWKLRQLVLGLSNKVIAEIKSFNKPLPDIVNVMQACFFLLGNQKKEISDWKKIVAWIGKTGKQSLKRRIGEFAPGNLNGSSVNAAKGLLSNIDINEIEETNKGVSVFYGWGCSVIMQVDDTFTPSDRRQ